MSDKSAEAVPAASAEVVPLETATLPAAPGLIRDAVGDLQQAWTAVQYVVAGDRADVSATLQTVVKCVGSTQVDALQAAVDFLRESPRAELHAIPWARVPGPVVGEWEFQATLIVSYPDGHGETTGATHHADRPSAT